MNLCGVSELTVCKLVHKVCNAICEPRKEYIKFPNDDVDQNTYKVQFYDYGNFPGVIGCIDGSHILIKCTSTEDAEHLVNKCTTHQSANRAHVWYLEESFPLSLEYLTF